MPIRGMKRRDFIAGLSAAAWPVVARAQQPTVPVVGFLNSGSLGSTVHQVQAFRQGLEENGYLVGQNVFINFRWAEGQFDRLPALAADLISQKVTVIVAGGPPAAMAAKQATATIPIVFTTGDDPVKSGLVASLSRPGGNVTGVSILLREMQAKRLELLRELIPSASVVGLLSHPRSSNEDTEAAARSIGLQLYTAPAATEDAVDAAFASFASRRVSAVLVGSDPALAAWRKRILALATDLSLPTVCEDRGYATDGCLMSYGADISDAYRQAGIYVARLIKGEKPSDLPVMQPTKFELFINLKTAKTLGLDVPHSLLARADEVIE
jgi:putative tryptophan/tyrosine transport system substrate-binding protein